MYDREILPESALLWQELLGNQSLEELEAAFVEVERTFIPTMACPFPTPAHVLAPLREREAENNWQWTISTIKIGFHPEFGWKPWVQSDALPERCHKAAVIAGGLRFLARATSEQLIWAKKDFITAYLRD